MPQLASQQSPPWKLTRILPFVGLITLSLSVIGSAVTGIWIVAGWVSTLQSLLTTIQAEEMRERDEISSLQRDMINVDRRFHAMEIEIQVLRNDGVTADARLRARLDVLEALGRFAAERAIAAPLPQPYRRP